MASMYDLDASEWQGYMAYFLLLSASAATVRVAYVVSN